MEEIVLASPEARTLYLDYLELHGTLHWDAAKQSEVSITAINAATWKKEGTGNPFPKNGGVWKIITMESSPDGAQREVTVPAGQAYVRDRGVEHNVINAGPSEMQFVEVEIKPQPQS